MTVATGKRSERMYAWLRAAVLHGEFAPQQPLRPQELATQHGVSLAVARESLLRLVGEGLADRLPNRGFVVPAMDSERWQQITEARATIEPAALRMAVERGDLGWEARVRQTHHVLAGTPLHERDGDPHLGDAWSEAHRNFHRTLLEGCGNDVLLTIFDRLWTDYELARRWAALSWLDRDILAEHREIEEAALARDADKAADLLRRHLGRTAEAMTAFTRIRYGDGHGVARGTMEA